MARETRVLLDDDYTAFVDGQVEKGAFGSASEVIEAGLKLLYEAKVEALRAALQEGLDSGPATLWNREEFLAELKARHAKKH